MTRLDPRRARDLERAIAPLNTLTILLGRHSSTVAANLAAWVPGPSSSTHDGGKAPVADDGSNPGPTARQAMRRDPIVQASRDLARHLEHAARSAETASRIVHSLLTIDPELAQLLADRTPVDRAGTCVTCGAYVANTPQDRIRSGRCEPCYRYRLRHEGMERPKVLWDVEEFDTTEETHDE